MNIARNFLSMGQRNNVLYNFFLLSIQCILHHVGSMQSLSYSLFQQVITWILPLSIGIRGLITLILNWFNSKHFRKGLIQDFCWEEGGHGHDRTSIHAGRYCRRSCRHNLVKKTLQSQVNCPAILERCGLSRSDSKRPDGVTLIPYSIVTSRGKAMVCGM